MAKGKTGDKNDDDDFGEDYVGEENNWEAASSFACD
jgi:hypothetical protein